MCLLVFVCVPQKQIAMLRGARVVEPESKNLDQAHLFYQLLLSEPLRWKREFKPDKCGRPGLTDRYTVENIRFSM